MASNMATLPRAPHVGGTPHSKAEAIADLKATVVAPAKQSRNERWYILFQVRPLLLSLRSWTPIADEELLSNYYDYRTTLPGVSSVPESSPRPVSWWGPGSPVPSHSTPVS